MRLIPACTVFMLFAAIIVGLMFGPVADALETRGVPEAVSAGVVVLMLLGMIAGSGFLFAGPPLGTGAELLRLAPTSIFGGSV